MGGAHKRLQLAASWRPAVQGKTRLKDPLEDEISGVRIVGWGARDRVLSLEQETELFEKYEKAGRRIKKLEKICMTAKVTDTKVRDREEIEKKIENLKLIRISIRNRIWESVQGMVQFEARRAERKMKARPSLFALVDTRDLIHEGNIALEVAVKRFDWKRSMWFRTYARTVVRRHIWRKIFEKESFITLNESARGAVDKILVFKQEFFLRNHREARIQEVAEGTGFTVEKITELLGVGKRQVQRTNDTEEERDLISGAKDRKASGSLREVIISELRDILCRCIERLSDVEQEILISRFGLDGEDELTLAELGEKYGCSQEWIRKIEKKAMAKLFRMLKEEGVEKDIVDEF